MQPTVLKKGSGLDVLAVVPYQLGFQPKDSLVVVALRPPRSQTGMMSRFDLTPVRQPGVGQQMARRLLQYIKADGATGAFLIRYAGFKDGPARHDPAMVSVVQVLKKGLDQVVCWDVVGNRIIPLCNGSLEEMEPSFTKQDLAGTRAAATMISQGATFQADRADLAQLPTVDRDKIRLAGRSQRRVLDKVQTMCGPRLVDWRLEEIARWRQWLEHLAKAGPEVDLVTVPASELGHMGALLQDIKGRDAVLAMMVNEVSGAEIRAAKGGFDKKVLAGLFMPGCSPDTRYLEAAPRLLALVAAHQAQPRRGSALALMAWFAWWHSDGARAEVLAEAALALPNPPSLAQMVKDLVYGGTLPQAIRLMKAQRQD